MGCPCFGNKPLLVTTTIGATIFVLSGFIFLAPYWMFDGISFTITSIIGWIAFMELSQYQKYLANPEGVMLAKKQPSNFKATVVYCIAAVSIPVEFVFAVCAIIYWDHVMNPWWWNEYGKNGSSFFFCSCFSMITNTFVVIHFRHMSQSVEFLPKKEVPVVSEYSPAVTSRTSAA